MYKGKGKKEKLYYENPHGGSIKYDRLTYKSGLMINVDKIIERYYVNPYGYVFSEDGQRLLFMNTLSEKPEYKQLYLDCMYMCPAGEDEYNRFKNHIKNSDMTAQINGVNVPLYSIGGAHFVRIDNLNNCGFVTNTDNNCGNIVIVHIPGKETQKLTTADKIDASVQNIDDVCFVMDTDSNGDLLYKSDDKYYLNIKWFGTPNEDSYYRIPFDISLDSRNSKYIINSTTLEKEETEKDGKKSRLIRLIIIQ